MSHVLCCGNKTFMRLVWFGIYKPEFGRNRVYMSGLKKLGHEIVECRDDAPGVGKFFNLLRKLKGLAGGYDAVVVGYPGHVVVPIAKLVSPKLVIADLLGSLYDAERSHRTNIFKLAKAYVADWLAVRFADIVLLESEAQKRYFEERFGKDDKFKVIYTGADEIFVSDKSFATSDKSRFLVLFRGSLTPESGIQYILEAAKLLRGEKDILFRIMGKGVRLEFTKKFIDENSLSNVELITEYFKPDELVRKMADADLMLGQFEDNPRLNRTIPHKAYEAFALGVPYLSGDALAVREIVREGETGFLVPLADPDAMAKKIASLSKQPEALARTAANERQEFEDKFSEKQLAQRIIHLLE